MFLENIWFVATILSLGVYGIVLAMLVKAFRKKVESKRQTISGLSIVVPVKNEAKFLADFFTQFSLSDHKKIDLEIIVVNDHSTDNSLACIEQFQDPLNLSVLNAPEGISGKKLCAKLGVEAARFPWILTIDIDAVLPVSFFKNLSYSIAQKIQYAIVPLKPKKQNSLVRSFFDLEFISLHFVGMASAKLGKPLLSNAACSLFRKEAFLKTIYERSDWEEPSGDDVFAMFAMAKKYGNDSVGIAEFDSKKVEVDFPNKLSDLWLQRLRWIGKSTKIKNTWFLFVSGLVLFFNLVLGSAILQTIFFGFSTNYFGFLVAGMLIQFSFLMYVCKAVGRRDLIKWILPLTLVYPFYLIAIAVAQFFWKSKWK